MRLKTPAEHLISVLHENEEGNRRKKNISLNKFMFSSLDRHKYDKK